MFSAIEPYAKNVKDPTLAVFAMENEQVHPNPDVLGQAPVHPAQALVFAKDPGDRALGNVCLPDPGGRVHSDK